MQNKKPTAFNYDDYLKVNSRLKELECQLEVLRKQNDYLLEENKRLEMDNAALSGSHRIESQGEKT
ncbi:MAG: hypothetical protein RR365_10835 [Bacteroides sp.]